MIISGGSRSNWRFFAKHLMRVDENERVEVREIRGLAGETVLEALREMDALASGTRCTNAIYHANLNPRADEVLTPAQWEQAVDTLEHELGLDGHSRFVVVHYKEGREHIHVVWSRVDVDSMTAVSDSRNYAAHERAARTLEQAFGHAPVVGAHGKDGKRPDRLPKSWETFRGHGTGVDPAEVTREITALWQQADSGKAFAASLAAHGYQLCRGDRRDFCVMDAAGDVHSLARRIDGAKAAEIRARMADVDRAALPSAADAQPIAQPALLARDEPSREAASEVVEPSLASARAEAPAAPDRAPASPLDAFAGQVREQLRSTSNVEPRAEAQPWWQRPVPGPVLIERGLSLLDHFAHQVVKVMRSNGGELHLADGLTWLERGLTVLDSARDQVTRWARGQWEDLVDQFRDIRMPDEHAQSSEKDKGRDR